MNAPPKKIVVLHPFFFAAYPTLALLAFNISQVYPSEAIRPFLASVLVSAVFLLLFRLLTKEWHRAGLAVSWFLFFFFSFGHVLGFSEKLFPSATAVGRYYVLFATWTPAALIGPWWILRVLRRDVTPLTKFLNLVSGVAVLLSTYTILSSTLPVFFTSPSVAPASNTNSQATQPDIYYIILDGYGRSDILQEIYQYDNQPFLQALEQRGFYIATNSHSNYGQTLLSLSSSLNMTHLHPITEQVGEDSDNRFILRDLIHRSQVASLLRSSGYQFVAIASGYSSTEILDADLYISNENATFNSFEMLLLQDTLTGIFITISSLPYQLHRQSVLHVFDSLQEVATQNSPKFVFAHILSPHRPFLFDKEGNHVTPSQPFTLMEGIGDGTSHEEYVVGYREQLAYISQLTLETIDIILANSDTPPIIIVQGDHGPGSFLNWSTYELCVQERYSILNAYLVPDSVKSQLYDTITPVNSFRVLFDGLFGSQFELLPDTSYFSTWYAPYKFVDVTAETAVSCTR